MQSKEVKSLDRRSFMKAAGLGAGAAAGVAVATVSGKAEAAETVKSPTAAGYRETDHVKKYYELAKF